MTDQLRIVPIEDTEWNYCIVCGKKTKHRHAYSNNMTEKIPVCEECCGAGCKGQHREIEPQADKYYCPACNSEWKEEETGKVMDKRLCPKCQDVLEPRLNS